MKRIKIVSCSLSVLILICIFKGHATIKPPDTCEVYHQKVTLTCKNFIFQAERITNRKNVDSVIVLSASGKDVSGFEKFKLETSKGEIYILHLPNSNTVYVNSVSSISFNPLAPNFFYISRGEAFFLVAQNSKIYVDSDLYAWALSGTALNVKHYEDNVVNRIGISLVRGKARIELSENGQVLQAGKMFTYINEKLSVEDIDSGDVNSWVKQSFDYKAIPYHFLIERISQWYRKEVVFKNKIPRSHILFNGLFSESLAVILARLNEKRKKIKCYIDGDKVIVE